MLCNNVQREDAKLGPSLEAGLFCHVLLHKIWYGIVSVDTSLVIFFFLHPYNALLLPLRQCQVAGKN